MTEGDFNQSVYNQPYAFVKRKLPRDIHLKNPSPSYLDPSFEKFLNIMWRNAPGTI